MVDLALAFKRGSFMGSGRKTRVFHRAVARQNAATHSGRLGVSVAGADCTDAEGNAFIKRCYFILFGMRNEMDEKRPRRVRLPRSFLIYILFSWKKQRYQRRKL